MITVTISNKNFLLPASWNELTREQLLMLANKLRGSIDIIMFRTLLVCNFLGVRKIKPCRFTYGGIIKYYNKYTIGRSSYILSDSALYFISKELSFIYKIIKKNNQEHAIIDSRLTKQLLPVINLWRFKLYGPADGLTNLIFNEFIHAETNFSLWQKTNKPEYLDKLCGILYRRRAKKTIPGDPRIKFDDNYIDNYAKYARRLPEMHKHAIVLYYNGCRNFIATKYPNIFSGSGSGPSGKNVFEQYHEVTAALAQHDLSKIDKVRESFLYDALAVINNMMSNTQK